MKTRYIEWLIALAIGLPFTHVILGLEKLNPYYTHWLLIPGSDYSYHYLAWEYFKDTPWSWPLGKIEGYAYPMSNSVMYTDSIPVLAIIFKCFRAILPQDFQYFGLWYTSCYILNTWFALRLLRTKQFTWPQAALSSIFFTGAVVLVARFGHAALCGQWLILWAFLVYTSRHDWTLSRIMGQQYTVVTLAAFIHPYLFFMVLGLVAGCTLQLKTERTLSIKQFIVSILVYLLIGFIGWYLSGAFLFKGNLSEGLGKFSANLNTFINAWDVGRWGISLAYYGDGQGEGIGYLGLGMITLLLLLIPLIWYTKSWRTLKPQKTNWMLLSCILFLVFAWSPKWTWGSQLLIDWGYNDYISRTFRGTGRFIWPLYYFIFYWVLKTYKYLIPSNAKLTVCLGVGLMIQFFDLRPLWQRNKYIDGAPGPLAYEQEMRQLISKANKLIVYPPYAATIADFCDYIYFVDMAQHAGKAITTGYGARFPVHVAQAFRDSIDHSVQYLKKYGLDLFLTHADSLVLHQNLVHELGGASIQFERYRFYIPPALMATIGFLDTSLFSHIDLQQPLTLHDYLTLHRNDYILGVVQQEGLSHLSATTRRLFKESGSAIDSLKFGYSWLFVLKDNKIIQEKWSATTGVNDSLSIGCNAKDVKYLLQSGGHQAKMNSSSILSGDREWSSQKRGLQLVVLDSCGVVKDKVWFDTYVSDQYLERLPTINH